MKRFEPLQNEKIILECPKHWKNYIVPVLVVMLCLGGMALRLVYPDKSIVNHFRPETFDQDTVYIFTYLEVIIMALVLLMVSISMVNIAYTRYYVTSHRVISTSGWVTIRTSDMLLERVETVYMSQRFSERLFRSGDIVCVSAGASLYLDDVYSAGRFLQTTLQKMTEIKQSKSE